jgi:hypothetical protein
MRWGWNVPVGFEIKGGRALPEKRRTLGDQRVEYEISRFSPFIRGALRRDFRVVQR